MKVKMPKKIMIENTQDKGRGVFATKKIKKGEVIETSPVVLYERIKEAQIREWSSAEIVIQKYHNWGPWGGEDSPCTCMVLGYGAMYNHSDEPNLKIQKNLENLTISFIASKEISPGEEICHYYPMWLFKNQSREKNE